MMIHLLDFLLPQLIGISICGFIIDPVELMRGFLSIGFYLTLLFFLALSCSTFIDYVFDQH
ncbi:hypothetical protein [Acinetobacter pollinis]|uniref:hypothetical protein n=1 Tax=Acinetobacter pollinis TaxID=2605270 RepID=UPI0018A2EB20|nr:hypothetical protein [Acinetobacter pollinis]MBF7691729.1 hypothetical protein [Acinetobacter pollinis]MBF7699364.1 hypothetical protein [Acinetobacter pollinis]